jgi:outer membrane receptor protein involved in Fe transport
MGYTFETAGSWPELSLIANAENLFDRRPPGISVTPGGPPQVVYDPTNTSPLGRFVTLELRMRW